jgi:outer membrane beta-barrel protein
MKQAWRWLLVAAALSLLPKAALAQKKPKKPAAPAAQPAAGGEIELDAPAAPAAPAGTPPPEGGPAATPAEGGGAAPPAGGAPGGGICEIDPTACPKAEDISKAAKKDVNAEVYAVQQIYALRYHRFELQPWWAVTLNDQFVTHPGPGLGLNFYITNVLAVGVSGNYYGALNQDSDFNFQNRRAARIAVPLNDYLVGWNANFTYVPVYGKFAGFGNFIFSYDAYLLGGVGMIWTKPEAVIDPDNRKFTYNGKLDVDLGIGLRIFFNRWFALNLEIRDYIYNEQLENTSIAPTGGGPGTGGQQDPGTWYGANSLTNNVQAQVGVSVFLPFGWEYRLPK